MVKRRDTPSRRPCGFSLIELMITVALVAVLAVAAMPFAQSWMDGNRQLQVRSRLLMGVAQARALALRNPNGFISTSGTPQESARLYYDTSSRTFWVEGRKDDGTWREPPEPPEPADDYDPLVPWQSIAPTGNVSLLLASTETAFACVAFDTRGRLFGTGTCALPTGVRQVAVKVGSLEPLYVDLF